MNGLRARLDAWLGRVWYGRHALRFVLAPLALIVAGLVLARRLAYRRGWLAVHDLGVPVVVVGNLTVGGTGKTPVLVTLAGELAARDLQVGIVTRGYGGHAASWPARVRADSDPAEVGDEPVLLARRTGRPVVAGADRVAAARRLIAETSVDVVLSDDGLQHYRLGRAFEIAVVDGLRHLGNGWLLPAGPLREPASRLETVDAVVVNGPSFEHPGAYSARLVPTRVYALADGAETTLEAFAGRDVHAVAGIGHPERFFAMLRDARVIVHAHALPDHARVDAAALDLDPVYPVLLTEKDAVKCAAPVRAGVWCVAVEMRIDGVEVLADAVLRAIRAQPPRIRV